MMWNESGAALAIARRGLQFLRPSIFTIELKRLATLNKISAPEIGLYGSK